MEGIYNFGNIREFRASPDDVTKSFDIIYASSSYFLKKVFVIAKSALVLIGISNFSSMFTKIPTPCFVFVFNLGRYLIKVT